MRSGLYELSLIKNDQERGVAESRQAVRYRERRAVSRQASQRFLNVVLRLRVERRGRLIEDQDLRVVQQRARYRYTLALSARKRVSFLSDNGIVSVGEFNDKSVRARRFRRRNDRLARRAGRRIGDIVVDRSVEEERLLQNDAHLRAQRVLRQIAQVDAVDRDLAPAGIVKTHEKVDHRRLSGARSADDPDHFARFYLQGYSLENVDSFVVTERYVVEFDLAFDLDLSRLFIIRNVLALVDDVEDLDERGDGAREHPRQTDHPSERSVKQSRI